MIKAIGTDIVEIERFRLVLQRWGDRFINRVLTENEIAYCHTRANYVESMAVRFAAKEAVVKCLLPRQQAEFRWHDIEILNHASGKPYVRVMNRMAPILDSCDILISLSHSRKSAIAMVLIQANSGDSYEFNCNR